MQKKFKKEIIDDLKPEDKGQSSSRSQLQTQSQERRSRLEEDDDPLRVGPRRGGHYPRPEWLVKTTYDYCKVSNIRNTKSQNLNDSRLVLQLSLPNSVKLGVKLRMKMLEQRRLAMLQLHLSVSEWSWIQLPTKVRLILEVWRYIIGNGLAPVGLDLSENFHLSSFYNLAYFNKCIWFRRKFCAKIHLPCWQDYLPLQAIRQWDMLSPDLLGAKPPPRWLAWILFSNWKVPVWLQCTNFGHLLLFCHQSW